MKLLNNKQLERWPLEVWQWLSEAKLVFKGILAVLVVSVPGFVIFHSEESIRVAGYVLQLIGMVSAIRGLLGIREYFGQPLLRQLLWQWIKRCPRLKRSAVSVVSPGHIAMAGMKVRAEVWTPDDPEKSMEQRVEGIIRNLDIIRNEQKENSQLIGELKEGLEAHTTRVAEDQRNMEKRIGSNLESLHTSDLITSLVGLVLLTFGITMSTLAPELSAWLY